MDTLKINQIHEMLRLQALMNTTVNAKWIDAGYPFLRAVVVEAGEALEHVGWKWWKRQQPDLEQVQIELIDILHFYLSALIIEAGGDAESAAQSMMTKLSSSGIVQFDERQYNLSETNLLELLELLAGLAAARRIEFSVLQECFKHCNLTWPDVVRIYVSKNVLNMFRQAHGYKDGTYVKIWNGEEDNVVLARLANSLGNTNDEFSKTLYSQLQQEYMKVASRV